MPGFLAEQFYKKENGWIRAAMKAAEVYQVPPLFLLNPDRIDQTLWSEKDKKLVVGYRLLQDEICPSCGIPMWLGHTESNAVDFEVKKQTCYSCAALDSHDRDKDAKGVTPYVVPVATDERGLPTREEGMKAIP